MTVETPERKSVALTAPELIEAIRRRRDENLTMADVWPEGSNARAAWQIRADELTSVLESIGQVD